MARPSAPAGATPSRQERHHSRDVRRTRFMLLGATVLSAVILLAWFPASALYRQHASLASANSQLRQLHQQDAALAQERKNLSDAAEIARIAREQYQLVSPGQSAYAVLPPTGATTANAPYAGDPGLDAPVAPSATSELPPSTTSTVPPVSHAAAGHASSTNAAATHSPGVFDRMLHALEFWR